MKKKLQDNYKDAHRKQVHQVSWSYSTNHTQVVGLSRTLVGQITLMALVILIIASLLIRQPLHGMLIQTQFLLILLQDKSQ